MPFDVPMRFETEQMLWTIDQIYTPSECAALVTLIEQSSPTLATNNPMYRDQDRVIRDDPELANDLFRRLRPHLPGEMGPLRLVALNDRLRFYRYRPGQRFEPHMDHWYRPTDRQITLHTVLAYFNDDFEGGETVFQEQLDRTRDSKDRNGRDLPAQASSRRAPRPSWNQVRHALGSHLSG